MIVRMTNIFLIVGLLTGQILADRELFPGERIAAPPSDLSRDYIDDDNADQPQNTREHDLMQLKLWLQSRELAARLQDTAEQAAVAAARADGQYSAATTADEFIKGGEQGRLPSDGDYPTSDLKTLTAADSELFDAIKEDDGKPSIDTLKSIAEEKAVAAARSGDGTEADTAFGTRVVKLEDQDELLGNNDDDFTFAVGPGDPRFFDNQIAKSDSENKMEQIQHVIDIDGEEDEQRSEDGPIVRPVIHGTGGKSTQPPMTFIAIVAACCTAGVVAIVLIGVCSYKLQKKAKAAADVEYPAYGVTGPSKDISPGSADRRMAQSAQMYHYQHQKQQIIAMERASNDRRGSASEPESEDENDEGDYTVYECPGLASTREMEVKNPLFLDEDATPASPARQPADTSAGQPSELPK